ncbi:hypothetical protein JYT44_02770 [Caldithrix abyssi]|nr:hypothetical protein [Caldithrix abyssi]
MGNKRDVEKWQRRLEDNFGIDGYVGGNLYNIYDMETECGTEYLEFAYGQNILIESFQSFFLETLENALQWVNDHGWPKGCESYHLFIVYYTILFRSFRACENLLYKGYPLDGYSLLRDLKDRTIFLSAIANNITTFKSIFVYGGIRVSTDKNWRDISNKRKKEEFRILNLLIRKDSGFPKKVQEALDMWEMLFHEEVHGSKFSFLFEYGDWVKNKTPLLVGPTPKLKPMAMYMNRASEIAWMIVRLLPYLQVKENSFGDRWHEKHKILDESFRFMQKGLSKIGKEIGDAFISFVDEKFSFKSPFYYFEADGTR